MLRTNTSSDSLASAAYIVVKFDGFDAGGGASSKSVEKSLKSRKSSKNPESLKGRKNLQRPSVWRNVYQSTGPLSTKNSSFF